MGKKKKIGIALLCSILVLCILVAAIPFLLLCYSNLREYVDTKYELDNPYINSGLRNWKTASVEDAGVSFRIPPQWNISGDHSEYTLTDESGTILAYLTSTAGARQGETVNWLQKYMDYPSVSDTRTSLNYNLFCGEVSFFRLVLQGDNGKETVYYELNLQCKYDIHRFLKFAFCQGSVLSDEEIIDYMEAIAFSFYFD